MMVLIATSVMEASQSHAKAVDGTVGGDDDAYLRFVYVKLRCNL